MPCFLYGHETQRENLSLTLYSPDRQSIINFRTIFASQVINDSLSDLSPRQWFRSFLFRDCSLTRNVISEEEPYCGLGTRQRVRSVGLKAKARENQPRKICIYIYIFFYGWKTHVCSRSNGGAVKGFLSSVSLGGWGISIYYYQPKTPFFKPWFLLSHPHPAQSAKFWR